MSFRPVNPMPQKSSERWSIEEIDAALEAYFWMLSEQRHQRRFVKSWLVRELRTGKLSRRSKAAVERRFQNISHLLHERGSDWVRGYAPLRHTGEVLRLRLDMMFSTKLLLGPPID
jgi:hypothetical protein